MEDFRSENNFTKSMFPNNKTMFNKVKKKKRIRVPISFNKSRSFNASFNSTFSKVSLSANNRALARALQLKKEQLYNAVQVVQQMQINEQKYLQELASSKEVMAKMKKVIEDMEKAQAKVFVSLNQFITDLTKTVDIYSTLQKCFSDFLGSSSPEISATPSPALPKMPSSAFINKRRPKRCLNKPARVLATAEDRTDQTINTNSPETSTGQGSGDKDRTLPECPQVSASPDDGTSNRDHAEQSEDVLQPLASASDVPYQCSAAPDLSMITEQSFIQALPDTMTFNHHRVEKHQSTNHAAETESRTETPVQRRRSRSQRSLNRRQTRVMSRNSTDHVKLAEDTKRLEEKMDKCYDMAPDVPKEVDIADKNHQSNDNAAKTSTEPATQNTRSRSRRRSVNRRTTGVISNNMTDLIKLSKDRITLDDKMKLHSDAATHSTENTDGENRLMAEGISNCAERSHATHQPPDAVAGEVKKTETAEETVTRCTRSRSRSCVDRRLTRVLCTNSSENSKLGEDRKQLNSKLRDAHDAIGDASENVHTDLQQTADEKRERNRASRLSVYLAAATKKAETGTEPSVRQTRSRSRSHVTRRQTRVLHKDSIEFVRRDDDSRDLGDGILEQCIPLFDTSESMDTEAQNNGVLNSAIGDLPTTVADVIGDDYVPSSPPSSKSSGNDDLRKAPEVPQADGLTAGQMCKGVEHRPTAGYQSSEVTTYDVQDMDLTEVISPKDGEKIQVPAFNTENNSSEPSFLKSVDGQDYNKTESIANPGLVLHANVSDDRVVLKKSKLPQPCVGGKSRKAPKSDDIGKKNNIKEKKETSMVVPVKNSKNVPIVEGGSKKKESSGKEQANCETMSVNDTDSSCPSDSESETVMKRYMAYLVKPGKISFTAGRRDCSDFFSNNASRKSRSKSRSILPTMQKSRSKSRSKSNLAKSQPAVKSLDVEGSDVKRSDADCLDSVFEFISPRSRRRQSGTPKDPADVSLSESTCQPKPSYSQFCGREMPHPKRTIPVVCCNEGEITDSPHGIMLVLANGRRTKPRSKLKSVHYKREIHRIISPECSPLEDSEVDNMQKEPLMEDVSIAFIQPMAVDAGNTPVRRPTRKKSIRDEDFCVPESPVVDEGTFVKGGGPQTADVNTKQLPLDLGKHVADDYSSSDDSPIVRRKAGHQRQQQLMSLSSDEDDEEPYRLPAVKKKRLSTKSEKTKAIKSVCLPPQLSHQSQAKTSHQEEEASHKPMQQTTSGSSAMLSEAGQVTGHSKGTVRAVHAELHDMNGILPKIQPEGFSSDPEVNDAESDGYTASAKQQFSDHQKLNSHHDNSEETEKENIAGPMKESNCQQEETLPRKRRAAALVKSYKEPVINKKLRQGDEHTSTIYGKDEVERFKSEINNKKRKKSTMGKMKQHLKDGFKHSEEERKRSALATISNTCSSSDSG